MNDPLSILMTCASTNLEHVRANGARAVDEEHQVSFLFRTGGLDCAHSTWGKMCIRGDVHIAIVALAKPNRLGKVRVGKVPIEHTSVPCVSVWGVNAVRILVTRVQRLLCTFIASLNYIKLRFSYLS